MAKGQKRSNREIKKPKKQKAPAAASAAPSRGLSDSFGSPPPKKKSGPRA